MKKIYLIFFFLFFSLETNATTSYNKYEIKEGNKNAKVKIFVFESLTCTHSDVHLFPLSHATCHLSSLAWNAP